MLAFPINIKLGTATISLHLIFETLGMIIGFRYFLFLRKKQKDHITDNNRIIILIGATFGALFFSRIIGALENPLLWIHSKSPWLYLYANKTIVGGLLGGLLFVEIIKKFIHERNSSGDLFTYPLILAMMIGRLGCFSSGLTEETYGLPTSFFMGINFGDGLYRHPVSLYEILFLGCLWITLKQIERRRTFISGYRFQFFMIAYLAFRFALDFLKPHYSYAMGLSAIQISCLLGLLYYSRTLYKIFFNFSSLIYHGK